MKKKFNLDGPDGWAYYWHDLRKEPEYLSKRRNGGGSVLVCAGFGFNGKTKVEFVDGTLNAEKYADLLNKALLKSGRKIGAKNWILQQVNAPCHTANHTKNWFIDKNIRVLEWPSRSSDLNPVENLWGILVRDIYRNGKQFGDEESLKKAICNTWDKINEGVLKNLVNSMKNRIFEVISKNGAFTKY